jgi:hypothetical protein
MAEAAIVNSSEQGSGGNGGKAGGLHDSRGEEVEKKNGPFVCLS